MAARVNGEGLLLSDYEEELKRYQAGLSELGQDYDPVVSQRRSSEDDDRSGVARAGCCEAGICV